MRRFEPFERNDLVLMRVVLDTNILISALIVPGGAPDILYQAWRIGRFTLVTSEEQLNEFRRVSRYPRLRPFIQPAAAGTMLNELKLLADTLVELPSVDVSRDPADNFLLAMAVAGRADYLVTGDKGDVLHLSRYQQTRIVSARQMVGLLRV